MTEPKTCITTALIEPADTRQRDALRALRQILRATELNSRSLAKQTGLNPSQLILMELLARHGRLTAGTIAHQMSLSQATVTALVDKLEGRSLVIRTRDAADKRRVLLALTDQGRALLGDAPDILQSRFAERFSSRKDWEQSFLVSALEQVADMLDAEDMDVAPVLDVGGVSAVLSEEAWDKTDPSRPTGKTGSAAAARKSDKATP